MKIHLVTHIPNEVDAAKARLLRYGIEVVAAPLEIEEFGSRDVEESVYHKALQAMKQISEPFIIEDSAFYVETLGPFPGTYFKTFLSMPGADNIICEVSNKTKERDAFITSILIYGNPETEELRKFIKIYNGKISKKPRGKNVRGWVFERIFIPVHWRKTLAELDDIKWHQFLEEFQQGDHYEQFGKSVQENSKYTELY